jgi:hypothetical protein
MIIFTHQWVSLGYWRGEVRRTVGIVQGWGEVWGMWVVEGEIWTGGMSSAFGDGKVEESQNLVQFHRFWISDARGRNTAEMKKGGFLSFG